MLFTLLVADMQLWVKKSNLSSYADDTVSFIQGKDLEQLRVDLEEDAKHIFQFMRSNRLVVNPEKTKFLLLQNKKKETPTLSINIDGVLIEESLVEKHLGVLISNNLKWDEHIHNLCSKLRQKLGIISRLLQAIPRDHMLKIVDAFFMSHIRYGLAIYGKVRFQSSDPVNQLVRKVQVLLNDALRLVFNVRMEDHVKVEDLLARADMLSVNQLTAEVILCETWKSQNNTVFDSLFRSMSHESGLVTRSVTRRDLVPENFTRNAKNQFHYQAVKLWNLAGEKIRSVESYPMARREIRSFVGSLPI